MAPAQKSSDVLLYPPNTIPILGHRLAKDPDVFRVCKHRHCVPACEDRGPAVRNTDPTTIRTFVYSRCIGAFGYTSPTGASARLRKADVCSPQAWINSWGISRCTYSSDEARFVFTVAQEYSDRFKAIVFEILTTPRHQLHRRGANAANDQDMGLRSSKVDKLVGNPEKHTCR
jgi:hypothetical protein